MTSAGESMRVMLPLWVLVLVLVLVLGSVSEPTTTADIISGMLSLPVLTLLATLL
jgi:hypothetical protein